MTQDSVCVTVRLISNGIDKSKYVRWSISISSFLSLLRIDSHLLVSCPQQAPDLTYRFWDRNFAGLRFFRSISSFLTHHTFLFFDRTRNLVKLKKNSISWGEKDPFFDYSDVRLAIITLVSPIQYRSDIYKWIRIIIPTYVSELSHLVPRSNTDLNTYRWRRTWRVEREEI